MLIYRNLFATTDSCLSLSGEMQWMLGIYLQLQILHSFASVCNVDLLNKDEYSITNIVSIQSICTQSRQEQIKILFVINLVKKYC